MEQIQDQLTFSSASLGVNVGIASAKLDISSSEMSLRAKLKQIAQGSKGLFIAVDEVQDAPVEEMRIIASTVQLLIGEKANIALAFAGLPSGVMDLINGKALTFLRRAVPEDLAPINQIEIALSLSDSFNATGLSLDGDLLIKSGESNKGYAYLVQLVGYSIWQRATFIGRNQLSLLSAMLMKVSYSPKRVSTTWFTSLQFLVFPVMKSTTCMPCARIVGNPRHRI